MPNGEPYDELRICTDTASAAREAQATYQSRGDDAGADRMGDVVNNALDRFNEIKTS